MQILNLSLKGEKRPVTSNNPNPLFSNPDKPFNGSVKSSDITGKSSADPGNSITDLVNPLSDSGNSKTDPENFLPDPGKLVVEPDFSLQILAGYSISDVNRDQQDMQNINIEKNDKILEFIFDDDTTWFCDARTLHELFPDIDQSARRGETTFEVPLYLEPSTGERGNIGGIAPKYLNVYLKKKQSPQLLSKAHRFEDKILSSGEGLFSLDRDFIPKSGTSNSTKPNQPFLLFIHGTCSNIYDTFSQLSGTEAWKHIHDSYGTNVLAYQYRSLTKSGLRNVVDLVRQLPDAANLHIISHGAGGILGDILCRYANR
ncbi:MAG: hypothetical protein EOP48_03375, partial [Sphingobacteriales bacterium]